MCSHYGLQAWFGLVIIIALVLNVAPAPWNAGLRWVCKPYLQRLVCGYLSLVWSYQNIPSCLAPSNQSSSLHSYESSSGSHRLTVVDAARHRASTARISRVQDDRRRRFRRYRSASTEYRTVVSFVMRSILTLLSDVMSRDSCSNNGSQ